ncbi:MAG: response regulator [Chloroflexi bacterium]|nr:response regulator [Chloroflexota bacterium]
MSLISILDQAMPGLSGTDLAQEIMAIRPDIPVIIYTGYLGSLNEEKTRSIGVKALLVKPLEHARFACELRRVLDESASDLAAASDNLNCHQYSRFTQST